VILHLCRPITKEFQIPLLSHLHGLEQSTFSRCRMDWLHQNGVFGDAGELVYVKPHLKQPPVSGSFTVPTLCGKWIHSDESFMKYNAIPTACEAFMVKLKITPVNYHCRCHIASNSTIELTALVQHNHYQFILECVFRQCWCDRIWGLSRFKFRLL
jgi:hypothetical protein